MTTHTHTDSGGLDLPLPAGATWEQPSDPPKDNPGHPGRYVFAVRYQTVREARLPAPDCIRSAADAAALFRRYIGDPDREHFFALALSTRHIPLGLHTVSIGGLASAPIHPREVFAFAIERRAAAVIVGHNHPSGDPEPSRDDIAITEQLKAAGRLLGIELLDHIITGATSFVSLRERRLAFP